MTEAVAPAVARPRLCFFDHADAFEDFYPHYGVSQSDFMRGWHGSGNHALVRLLQRCVADVLWLQFSVDPQQPEALHPWCGCRVRFIATSWLHRLLWRGYYLTRHGWRLRPLYPIYALVSTYSASLAWGLLKQLRREKPALLFCQDYSSGRFDVLILLGRILGVRVVAYHAGSTPQHYASQRIKRRTLKRAHCLLASSRREAEMLATTYGVPRDRLAVLLTPIDTEAFRPMHRSQACADAGLDPDRLYLLYVGRLDDRVKRVGLLIDRFAGLAVRLPRAVLLIVGDGGERAELERRAQASAPADTIRFLGWKQGAGELAPLYAAADCLLLVSRSEGFPTVVGEAMACGTPVIATDVGGVGEIVQPGINGWLLPAAADDVVGAALEQALVEAVGPGRPALAMRAAAREAAVQQVSYAAAARVLQACLGSP